jgi:hypothetical protein
LDGDLLSSLASSAVDETWPVPQEVEEYLPLNTHLQTAVSPIERKLGIDLTPIKSQINFHPRRFLPFSLSYPFIKLLSLSPNLR